MTQNFAKQPLYNCRNSESEEIDASRIRNHLRITGFDIPILHFPEIDSTNLEVQRQLDMGRSAPFAILASKQQSGRGRLGRRWHSPEEGNCYLSFAFTPDAEADKLQQLTCWIGLEICQLLRGEWKIPVHMKWPNDLKIGHRKVGGMLCESRTEGEKLLYLVSELGLTSIAAARSGPPRLKKSPLRWLKRQENSWP